MKSIIRWILFIPTIIIVNFLTKQIIGWIGMYLFPKYVLPYLDLQNSCDYNYSWNFMVFICIREYASSYFSILLGILVLEKSKKTAFYSGLLICIISYSLGFFYAPIKLNHLSFWGNLREIVVVVMGLVGLIMGVFSNLKEFKYELDINSKD